MIPCEGRDVGQRAPTISKGKIMKRSFSVGAAVGLIASVFVMGTIDAAPDESQRLRGIAGREFGVEVTVVDVTPGALGGLGFVEGQELTNCYEFFDDGTWLDPVFVPGPWEQHTNGASTTLTADASADIDVPGLGLVKIDLNLEGAVRPVPASRLGFTADTVLTSSVGDRVVFEQTGYEGCS